MVSSLLEYRGERMTVVAWARRIGIHSSSLRERLAKMSVAEALSLPKQTHFRHGYSRSPIHNLWSTMVARCTSPKSQKWRLYGGRGIRVCDRWLTFENFLADMGERPSSRHSVDRIDSDGNYEPGNCRWATQAVQQRNRRNNKIVEFNGESMCIAAWSERTGIEATKLGYRIRAGWPIDLALTVGATR